MVRIVVADDHMILIQGIRKLIESESSYTVVGEASEGREAVRLVKRLKPDIAVLDITMP
jgi:YesN/AraC family two-component response regulator